MWTTSCLFALVYVTLNPSPRWHDDYGQALARAKVEKKPVAVFIGSGPDGWKTACAEGEPSYHVRRLLADQYVCMYVDAGRLTHQYLAQSFEAGQSPMVVLSSQNGAYQAYRHSGKLANASLAQALQRHAREDVLEAYNDPPEIRPVANFSAGLFNEPICRT